MNTTIVVNPDESIMIGSNNTQSDVLHDEEVEDIQYVHIPYGLLCCVMVDYIVCMHLLIYQRYYLNFAILFFVVNVTLYGIYTMNTWTIKLYCAYHFMSIMFLGLYSYIIYAIIYSVYHILCIYQGIICIKSFKMLLSNNLVIAV